MFIQRPSLTGATEWVYIPDSATQDASLFPPNTYIDMLHDKERNSLYYDGIVAAMHVILETFYEKCNDAISNDDINTMQRTSMIRILDIGTGTGFLSMLASLAIDAYFNKHKNRSNLTFEFDVIGVECFQPMATLAKRIISDNENNGFPSFDRIRIIPKLSTDLRVLDDNCSSVSLIVSEIFDSGLLGEGVLPSLRHALTSFGCQALVVPSCVRVYGQLIYSALLVPTFINRTGTTCSGDPSVATIPCHARRLIGNGDIIVCSSPFLIFNFDLSSPPSPMGRREQRLVSLSDDEATRSSMANGLLFWWDVSVSMLETPFIKTLSLSPHGHPYNIDQWREHWMPCLYALSRPTLKPTSTIHNNSIWIECCHDDSYLWFSYIQNPPTTDMSHLVLPSPPPRPVCDCGFHSYCRWPSRVAQLSNATWLQHLTRRLGVMSNVKDAVMISVDDGGVMAMLAAENDIPTMGFLRHIDTLKMNRRVCHLKHLAVHWKLGTNDDIISTIRELVDNNKHVVVAAEPLFASVGVKDAPWSHALLYRNLISSLSPSLQSSRSHISVVPNTAHIKIVPIYIPQLWSAYRPLTESIYDINLNLINRVVGGPFIEHSNVEDRMPHLIGPVALSNYHYHLLCRPRCVLTIPFNFVSCEQGRPTRSHVQSSTVRVSCAAPMGCHGIACYVDYDSDLDNNNGCVPSHAYVRLLETPVVTASFEISVWCDGDATMDAEATQESWDAGTISHLYFKVSTLLQVNH